MPDERSTSSQAGGDSFINPDDFEAETAAPLPWYRSNWVLGGLLVALIAIAGVMLVTSGDGPEGEASATTVASLTPTSSTTATSEPSTTSAPETTTTAPPATTEPPVAIATTPPATVDTDTIATTPPATVATATTEPIATATTEPIATTPPATTATVPPTSDAPPTTAPAPAAFSFSGSGDETVEFAPGSPESIDRWAMRITHAGSGEFSISTEDANGDEATMFAVTGAYAGDRPFGFGVVDIETISIAADADWTIDLIAVDDLPVLDTAAGASIDGEGDRLVRFAPGEPSSIGFACDDCAGTIVITAFASITSDVLLDGMGTGSSFLSNLDIAADIEVVAIQTASGDVAGAWRLTVG